MQFLFRLSVGGYAMNDEYLISEKAIIKKWKRPDWKAPDEYSFINKYSAEELVGRFMWYWQFLRRREDYQTDFLKSVPQDEYTKKRLMDAPRYKRICPDGHLMPNDKGYTATIYGATKKYNVFQCFNPIEDEPQIQFFKYGISMSGRIVPKPKTEGLEVKSYDGIACGSNEVLIRFDLDLPIKEQLEQAKQALVWRQNYYNNGDEKIKTPHVRRHSDKWLDYLRVLDARDYYNQKLEDIGLIINYEGLSEEELEDRLFEEGSRRLKSRGKALYAQAREVQFNFPF